MFEFLLTPEGQKVVAGCTVLLIGFAFFFNVHPEFSFLLRLFKRKSKPYVPSAKWTASQYYMHLNACILTCTTMDELRNTSKHVEGFFDKSFSKRISREKRKRYYARLLESVYQKEIFLTESLANSEVWAN